jgi:hypothetical protein
MSSTRPSIQSRAADDGGSAVVEFVLVGALVVLLAAGLFQLALTLHVRNILLSSASEGAHVGALADREPADGAERAAALANAALGGARVDAMARIGPGGDVVVVTLSTPVPVLGLWGAGDVTVTAHAIEESDG